MKMLKALTLFFILLMTLVVVPSATFAGEIRYSENLDLKVVRNNSSFQFIEIHNDREILLFDVPVEEMPHFIQTGEDLVDFQRRKKAIARLALFGFSTYLYTAVRLVLAVGAVLILENQLPEQDPILTRVSRVDLPYFLLSTQAEGSEEHNFEYDVREVIDSLVLIYNEYRQRMIPIRNIKENFQNIMDAGQKYCIESPQGQWSVDFPNEENQNEKVIARLSEENLSSISFTLYLDSDFKSSDLNRSWPGYRSEDSVAIVTYSKAYGHIEKIELGNKLSPSMEKRPFEIRSLFANMGILTNSVDRNLLVENGRLSQVYHWALALRTCAQ